MQNLSEFQKSAIAAIHSWGYSKGTVGFKSNIPYLFSDSEQAIKAGCSVVVWVNGNVVQFIYFS
jgi:hypothetical protein